jgi:hypothetical protein
MTESQRTYLGRRHVWRQPAKSTSRARFAWHVNKWTLSVPGPRKQKRRSPVKCADHDTTIIGTAIALTFEGMQVQGGSVMDCCAQCHYCHSPIGSGQRWVREKIYDPAHHDDPSYHRYHAEPFAGHEESCWEKHEMEREIVRTNAHAA